MNPPLFLTNRFTPAADGWFLLVPRGEHHWTDGKKEITQVVDDDALANMVRAFGDDKEALIDFEHESHEPGKRTEAAGWIDQVRAADAGLMAHARWSDLGEAALAGGRYRYISPVFPHDGTVDLGAGRLRVNRLLDAGLTNRPNMPVLPLANKEPVSTTDNPTPPAPPETKQGVPAMDYKAQLLALLGLAPEASDEDIAAACSAKDAEAKKMAEEIENQKKEICNRELDTLGITDPAQRQTAAEILTNAKDRPAALNLLRSQRTAPEALTNKQPPQDPQRGTTLTNKERTAAQRVALDAERAKAPKGTPYSTVFANAVKANPELFS
jgi:phage I-like protein